MRINKERIVERFKRYIAVDTQSDPENADHTPSTEKQFDLARLLKKEMEELGLRNITLSEDCFLFGTLPANGLEGQPVMGFIAHMDSSPDMSGKDIKPRIVHYEGGDIPLDKKEGITLSAKTFPELERYKGGDIMVTDGHTLLAADDKAGIAEIMEAVEYLTEHPEVKHGEIKVAFTPDEEVGTGADHFDVKAFGADFAYTMDGGEIGELEFENFNAASAVIRFKGRNVHPGYAKGKMVNAQHLAMEYHSYLPTAYPENTEGYEGFYHLTNMSGTVEEAELHYILRDHDREQFELKKSSVLETAKIFNEKYGEGTVSAEVKDQYFNMREVVEPKMYIVNHAADAMRALGITPKIGAIRGGTDGSKLSFMGLPCPNIFAGGHNFHGRYEYLPLNNLYMAAETVLQIVTTPVNTK